MDFGALKAAKKQEACGKMHFPIKWIDKRKEGVVKSRFTVADVRSKNLSVEQQQETFPPTPSALAGAIFEVSTLEQGFASATVDVVSAKPHSKANGDVCVRIPNELGKAVKGYESVMHAFSEQDLAEDRLLVKLEANVYGRRPAGAIGMTTSNGSSVVCKNTGVSSCE